MQLRAATQPTDANFVLTNDSIGKVFLWFIVFFRFETSAPGLPGSTCMVLHSSQQLTHHSRAKVDVFTMGQLSHQHELNSSVPKKIPGTKPRKVKHMHFSFIRGCSQCNSAWVEQRCHYMILHGKWLKCREILWQVVEQMTIIAYRSIKHMLGRHCLLWFVEGQHHSLAVLLRRAMLSSFPATVTLFSWWISGLAKGTRFCLHWPRWRCLNSSGAIGYTLGLARGRCNIISLTQCW